MSIGAPVLIAFGTVNPVGDGVTPLPTSVDAPIGSLIVVIVLALQPNLVACDSIADSAGNTYIRAFAIPATAGVFGSALFYSNVTHDLPSGGTITITYGSSGDAQSEVWAVNVSGVALTSPLDQVSTQVNTAAGTSASVSTGALSSANEIVFGSFFAANGANGFVPAPGFTSIATYVGAGVDFSYDIVSSTASVPYAVSWSTPAGSNVVGVASFKAGVPPVTHNLVGALAPTVTLGGKLSRIRLFAGNCYLSVALSATTISHVKQFAGNIAAKVTPSASLIPPNFVAFGGRLAPSIALSANIVPINVRALVATLTVQVHLDGSLTNIRHPLLQGRTLPANITLAASGIHSGPLWVPSELCNG